MPTVTDVDETATRAQRAIRRSIVIAVVGAVVGGVGSAIGGVRLEKGSDVVLLAIGGTITVAGLAGLVSVFLTLIDLLPELQSPVEGLDRAQRREIDRTIREGRPIVPDGSEAARRAFDRARGTAIVLPLQTTQLVLLSCLIAGPQIPRLTSGEPWQWWFSRIFLVVLICVIVWFVPHALRRVAAARRYMQAADESVRA